MEGTQLTQEMESLKNRMHSTWVAGDFEQIASSYAGGAAKFVEGLELKPGMRVLDAACGTGNLALPAARSGAEVTGIDIAQNLIEQAQAKAAGEDQKINFEIGDVENMPYEDGSFDVVMTMFGAMFAPRPDVTAAELRRVCRPGGVIAMANWTPSGFIGQMFKITAAHVAPPVGMPSPVLWGDETAVRRRFADGTADVQVTAQSIEMTFPFGPVDVVEHFRKFYGPTQKAFEALDEDGQAALRKELEELWIGGNTASDGTTRVMPEYMEVKAIRA